MQVVVYGKQFKEKDESFVQAVFDALHAEGVSTYVYTPFLESLGESICFPGPYAKFDDYLDFKWTASIL